MRSDRKEVRAALRRRALFRVLLSIWAFATLVLVLCVVLLAVEMTGQGQDLLASVKGTKSDAPVPVSMSTGESGVSKEATLFFAGADGRELVSQPARIDVTDSTSENCRHALEALIRGPSAPLTPILPGSTKIRGLYLLESGELVVDFSMELEAELKRVRSASVEGLLVYGVVNTLTQPALQAARDPAQGVAVKSVRFLIEGAPPRETFPSHLDAGQAVFPMGGLAQASETGQ
jgi:hypothetical protein